MENKQHAEKVVQIIKEYKSRPNKDLTIAMDFLKEDFEKTKDSLLKLTNHLDKVENSYNLLLKEYQSRNQSI
jgi:prefoldin subunit 5